MKIKNLILAVLMLTLVPFGLFAEDTLDNTTLSSAITTANGKSIVVASATGFAANYVIVIEQEAMLIASTYVSGTTIPIANRGYSGTLAAPHTSGSVVLVGPPNYFGAGDKQGACTASSQTVLPFVSINRNTRDVRIYNCNNGFWVQQNMPDSVPPAATRYCNVNLFGTTGATAAITLGSFGTSSTPTSGTQYYGTIFIPNTIRATGLSLLNGATAGTDTLTYTLYRANGDVLVSTAATTASGANAYQDIAFASTFFVTGPARYWFSVQTNGNTTRIRTVDASGFQGLLGSSMINTAGTITGLAASTTVTALPTSLVANTSPFGCLY